MMRMHLPRAEPSLQYPSTILCLLYLSSSIPHDLHGTKHVTVWVIFVDEQQRCHTEPLEKSVAAAGVYFPTKLGSLDSFGGQI